MGRTKDTGTAKGYHGINIERKEKEEREGKLGKTSDIILPQHRLLAGAGRSWYGASLCEA
jgi:hypothetical protein